jgi:hypothetical protein
MSGELLGHSRGVGAHQHRHPPGRIANAQVGGKLGERGVEHHDMIDRGVRAGLPRPQQLRHRFPATGGAMVDEPEQGMEPEGPLPCPSRVVLV